jgi:hypothetical protein
MLSKNIPSLHEKIGLNFIQNSSKFCGRKSARSYHPYRLPVPQSYTFRQEKWSAQEKKI